MRMLWLFFKDRQPTTTTMKKRNERSQQQQRQKQDVKEKNAREGGREERILFMHVD